MRLIDADAIIRDIDSYYHNSVFPHPGTTWLRGLELATGLLLRAPTIEAEPVRHGRWMPCGFGKEIKCSVCGCELDDVWEYRHCPNCGAKMDKGEE